MTSPNSSPSPGQYAVGQGWLLEDLRVTTNATGSTSTIFSGIYPDGGPVESRRPGLILADNAELYVYDGVNSLTGTYKLRRQGIKFTIETTTWVESHSDLSAAFLDLTRSTARIVPSTDLGVLVLSTKSLSFRFVNGDPVAGARAEVRRATWTAGARRCTGGQ